MAVTKTLGGDRVGSGKKLKERIHGYERSTHNLSRKVTTSMACGTLVPLYCNIAQDHDKWEIDIDTLIKTIPTIAPLFGSFKFQADAYVIPIRLYQGILHNNPTNIGLKMNQVILPKIQISGQSNNIFASQNEFQFVAPDALLKYCGISGIGTRRATSQTEEIISRKFNALMPLAYYDIFKNYYSNKQEKNAYIISGETNLPEAIDSVIAIKNETVTTNIQPTTIDGRDYYIISVADYSPKMAFIGTENSADNILVYQAAYDSSAQSWDMNLLGNLQTITGRYTWWEVKETTILGTKGWGIESTRPLGGYAFAVNNNYSTEYKLIPFELENIDNMRYKLLSNNQLGQEYVINDSDGLPYSTLTGQDTNKKSLNTYSQNGLVVKTYQSDIFNNWLRSEWIDGENGISEITSIDVSNGKLTIDAINLQEKLYNMLNRIVAGGGTYEDWLEAVYGEEQARRAETPMYIGGMSTEICFEEVVATAETATETNNKLGSLAGKGTQVGKKGGKLECTITEPSIIMIIGSITPRISYYQGNDWFNTEIDTMDDFHKPAMDGIGWQDLITEQMAWWDTNIQITGSPRVTTRLTNSAGKLPAWINYMTDVDRVYGDFCDNKKAGYMVLKRDYVINSEINYYEDTQVQIIKDLTTYIDPTKFNYAFAYQGLDAQNFWVQINFDIKCRRKMSARQIPNL